MMIINRHILHIYIYFAIYRILSSNVRTGVLSVRCRVITSLKECFCIQISLSPVFSFVMHKQNKNKRKKYIIVMLRKVSLLTRLSCTAPAMTMRMGQPTSRLSVTPTHPVVLPQTCFVSRRHFSSRSPTLLTNRFRTSATWQANDNVSLVHSKRPLSMDSILSRFGKGKEEKIKVDPSVFDKENKHYTGKIFGLPADDVIFYAKVTCGTLAALLTVYIFLKGYALLASFSLQSVARLGFLGGFFTCFLCYSVTLNCMKKMRINPNAVYNQSIALVMRNEKVTQFLGSHPRTGDFKTYSETGGFKFPPRPPYPQRIL
ncbi:hypothetical protein AGDE_07049 [Angomonas deanei]|nr:hypothetical protein AGDE_07049 [Angomonas deanei]|eukprot:EPY36167.1 hypothetical protein AGDE_07049 [Angomonas deanei]